MQAIPTTLPGVLLLEPRVFADARGFFLESYNASRFDALVGGRKVFVQDNHSRSVRNVLRGLHYQLPPRAQDKLVQVISGEIVDVVVDLRRSSPRFGQWESFRLSGTRPQQLWVPAGFAHGFAVLSESADVMYKVTDYYSPEHERAIVWSDPDLRIDWGLAGAPLVSPKDQAGGRWRDAATFP